MKEDPVRVYISSITAEFKTGQATEHAYRPALKELFESILPKLQAVNDPKHSEHGAPDFALMRSRELSAGYVEAKDLKVNLDETERSEQMKRYLEYGSLILTNSLEFRFYFHGTQYGEPIVVAKIIGNEIVPNEKAYAELEDTVRTFLTHTENITSSSKLSKIMGDKARRIRHKVSEYVTNENGRNEELRRIFESFKKILIHDLTGEQFADMYAQTLVYGLFAARYEDKSLDNFTREEARELIPRSNPFLRQFFDHIAGVNFDQRLKVIVNELCEVFIHADVHDLMNQYTTQKGLLGFDKEGADPVVHFYEDFLKEYDPEKRKKMGVFYTPLPVVRFIIRATDYLLQKEFGLARGLSDTTKIEVKITKQGKTAKESIHKVQILDPATGTGTFLNETVKHIARSFKGQEGRWQSYVENDLLPRLHGFELMMAPYTIAHLKIAMTLHDSGINNFRNRLGIFLTNSLEEGVKIEESLFGIGFGQSITDESKAASKIKNETPIMVIIGNPPYSVSSSNKGSWITDLIKIYKNGLDERNIQPLSDDYIKFIRFAEHFIEKNCSGIVSMITNNAFLDGRIHRQMRKHLLETFDDLFIVNLHGNYKKKEKASGGGKDENVFAIQQGVAIFVFVRKTIKKSKLGSIHYTELSGKRDDKFSELDKFNFQMMKWKQLEIIKPHFFFVPKNFASEEEYSKGFKIDEIFIVGNAGSATGKDSVFVQMTKEALVQTLESAGLDFSEDEITDYLYRPFDVRKILYDNSKIQRLRTSVMDHLRKDNLALITCKQQTSFDFQHVYLSRDVADRCVVSLQTGEVGYVFPLYLYADDISKSSNFKKEVVSQIETIVGKVSPEDIFDYIYAILHSPTYREKYREFLKIDFPRVPYPKDAASFKSLVALGRELRELHLMESPKLNNFVTIFSEQGSDTVESKYPKYQDGKVFINPTQYFGGVPEVAWNFYIGGYQPAQKWLKDRRSRKLTSEDIVHYQKMIVALVETGKLMREIDKL